MDVRFNNMSWSSWMLGSVKHELVVMDVRFSNMSWSSWMLGLVT